MWNYSLKKLKLKYKKKRVEDFFLKKLILKYK